MVPARFLHSFSRSLTVLAAGGSLTWIWISFCNFPGVFWNEGRFAAAAAFSRGWSVYPTATEGVVNTWVYGPLPLIVLLPATWFNTPTAALIGAGAINTLVIAIPLVLTVWFWPGLQQKTPSGWSRFAVLAVLPILWPEYFWHSLFADSFVVAFGLLGNLMLIRHPKGSALWISAGFATAAMACKQTAIGIPLAQVAWIGWTMGWRAGVHHATRCVATGVAWGLAGVSVFGFHGMWFTMVELPGRGYPWVDDIFGRLTAFPGRMLALIFVPVAIMVLFHRKIWHRDSPFLLPSLAYAACLLPGFAAFLKFGGSTNSIHSYSLWLPAALVAFNTAAITDEWRSKGTIGLTLLALGMVGHNLYQSPARSLTPSIGHLYAAERLVEHLPHQVWFPWNPLVSLFVDQNYTHDEDGLLVRQLSGAPISVEHFRRHMPRHYSAIAIPEIWSINRTIPPDQDAQIFQGWRLQTWNQPQVLLPGATRITVPTDVTDE